MNPVSTKTGEDPARKLRRALVIAEVRWLYAAHESCMSRPEPSSFEKELEHEGEEKVRLSLAYGAYSAGKKPLVESWLRTKAEEKELLRRKQEAMHKETEIGIGQSAKNAAWVAAIAAVISIVISIVAVIVSLQSK